MQTQETADKTMILINAVISRPELISPKTRIDQPIATIDYDVRGGRFDTIKISVANSFSVKEALKTEQYKFDGGSREWVVFLDCDEETLADEIQTLKRIGVAVHSGSMAPRETKQLWDSVKK